MPRHVCAPALIICAISLHSADWPQWRGPNRDGVWTETNVLQTFPAEGLKVEWRVPAAYGFSSPVIADGRVCLTDCQLKAPNVHARIHCFDEKTGAQLWEFSQDQKFPDWAFARGTEAMPNGTPILHNGKLYAPGPNGHTLFCLDVTTGALLWQKDLAAEYQIEENAAFSSSPLLDGDRLIIQPSGQTNSGVVALNALTGRELWRSIDEHTAHSSPVIIKTGPIRQLIIWTLQSVTSLDPLTGKAYWREREVFPTASSAVVSTPAVERDRLLISGLMLKLELEGNKPSASLIWPKAISKRILSNTSTPLLRDGLVYSVNQSAKFVCLDGANGQQIWESDKVTDGKSDRATSAHLTVNGDSVLIFTDQGVLIRARLTRDGYHEISRAKIIEPDYQFGGRKIAWSAPSYANRHVFVRNETELLSVSLAK